MTARRRLQRLDLDTHLHAQLGIEIGQRLVEEEDRRLAHDGPAHGDALALAAGKLARLAVEIGLELQHLRRLADALGDLRLGNAGDLQPVGPCWRKPTCADRGRSSGTPWRCRARAAPGSLTTRPPMEISPDVMVSSPATMRSRVDLPQPRGADDDDQLAVGDLRVDPVDDLGRSVGLADVG